MTETMTETIDEITDLHTTAMIIRDLREVMPHHLETLSPLPAETTRRCVDALQRLDIVQERGPLLVWSVEESDEDDACIESE